MVQVKLRFSLQFVDDAQARSHRIVNSFRVTVDGQVVFDETLRDETGGMAPRRHEPIIQVPKGRHVVRVELKEKPLTGELIHDFQAPIGIGIGIDTATRARVQVGTFPFGAHQLTY